MDINFLGHIEGIRYSDTAVMVTASERRQGYKRKDGVIIDDDVLTFCFIFKPYFKKYISSHFFKGMLVKIKGFMLPYAKNHQGDVVDGYSIIGQTIDMAAYPSKKTKIEKKMIKESQASGDGIPNIDDYNMPDF